MNVEGTASSAQRKTIIPEEYDNSLAGLTDKG